MGQISLPVMNRTGYSTFWQSVWDDKYNYTRGWKEDYYIREFLPALFSKKPSTHKYLLNIANIKKSPLFKDSKNLNFVEGSKYYSFFLKKIMKRTGLAKSYILRVWIIKFNSWIILYFTIYTPVKGQNNPTIDSLRTDGIHPYPSYQYLGLYHLSLCNLKFNNYYSKQSFLKKYSF